jgi:hypothetical protein
MGESQNMSQDRQHEDVIAAFDREREAAQELGRHHHEQVRSARAANQPVYIERRRNPR